MKTQLIKVAGIKCLMCGDTIYSRANHDFRWCSCKNCYVDGGPTIINGNENNYSRMGWTVKNKIIDVVEIIKIPDKVNPKAFLFRDWNQHSDEYGLIKDDKYTKEDLIAAQAQLKLLEK